MPKPVKPKPKQKAKAKRKAEPEAPGITTKKSYWVMLAFVLAVASGVLGVTSGLDSGKTVFLTLTILAMIGCVGFIRVTPSSLSISKRLTFIFVGISIIGFGIWAAIVLLGGIYGLGSLVEAWGSQFFAVTTLVMCLSLGALIGELIGRNKEVQLRLFPANMQE